jgi:hypothetical protein
VYDLILAHYNPVPDGSIKGTDLSGSIADIGWSTGTFDGKILPGSGLMLGSNLPPRKVDSGGSNLVQLNSLERKAANGNINNVFYGSLNTAMARYFQTRLDVREFKMVILS